MIRIFGDSKGNFAVQTTALDTDSFIADLSEALASMQETGGEAMMGVLTQAMPIAFKLSGYKAETVQEQRTLFCGSLSPHDSQVVATAGK